MRRGRTSTFLPSTTGHPDNRTRGSDPSPPPGGIPSGSFFSETACPTGRTGGGQGGRNARGLAAWKDARPRHAREGRRERSWIDATRATHAHAVQLPRPRIPFPRNP
eukprot:scaffold281_cov318-Pavlova_lutheri.AAC.43